MWRRTLSGPGVATRVRALAFEARSQGFGGGGGGEVLVSDGLSVERAGDGQLGGGVVGQSPSYGVKDVPDRLPRPPTGSEVACEGDARGKWLCCRTPSGRPLLNCEVVFFGNVYSHFVCVTLCLSVPPLPRPPLRWRSAMFSLLILAFRWIVPHFHGLNTQTDTQAFFRQRFCKRLSGPSRHTRSSLNGGILPRAATRTRTGTPPQNP